jgi:hypothetical protein
MKLSEFIPALYKKRHLGSITAARLNRKIYLKLKNIRKQLMFNCL